MWDGAASSLQIPRISTKTVVDICRLHSNAREFIIGTENGILYTLQKQNPNKTFISATDLAICQNMKRISLQSVVNSMEVMQYVIEIDPAVQEKAYKPVKKMLDITAG